MVKKVFLIAVLFGICLLILVSPAPAQASPLSRMIVGGSFTLEEGETLDDDLIILGGFVELKDESRVRGDVSLFGGSLDVNGRVDGDILAAGGVLTLGDTAQVDGSVTVAGAVLERSPGAEVGGEVITETDVPFRGTRMEDLWSPFRWWLNSVWNIVWYVGLAFGLAALAVLVVMFFEKPTQNASRTLITQPAISGGLGCLTIVVTPFMLLLFVISICLIPVALVAAILLGVVITFGWIALGLEVGQRLALQLRQNWAPSFAAGIGTFLLVIVAGLLNVMPFIGWTYMAVVSAIGIGSVLLTRFGMQDYAAQMAASSALVTEPLTVQDAKEAQLPVTSDESGATTAPDKGSDS